MVVFSDALSTGLGRDQCANIASNLRASRSATRDIDNCVGNPARRGPRGVTCRVEDSEMIFVFIAMAALAVVLIVLVASGEPDEQVKVPGRLDHSLKASVDRK